jgi:(p)ppGpp synthase/HD superfamily hydrolase
MHTYAQTNVQLFNQLRSEGYSKQERAFISNAYEFGMHIFTGLYLPSGKPFLDHLVGTASILASLRMPVEIVAAGLIHAAYLHGDFGSVRTGLTAAKRKQLRRVLGVEVPEYIAHYDRLLLTAQDISALEGTLNRLGQVERCIVIMRLANELEHHLDLGGLYYAHGEKAQRGHQRYMAQRGPLLVNLAARLGLSSLALEMESTFRNVAGVEIPLEPCIRCQHSIAYLVVPRSYRERFAVLCRRKLRDAPWVVLRRVKRQCCKFFRFMRNVVQACSRPPKRCET